MQNASLGDRGAYFVENYMEKLFYFCLRKTGDSDRAADLTQDTALHILTALQSGQHVENFSAWVWQIAHNRYARWAAIRRRERESMTGIDIENMSWRMRMKTLHSSCSTPSSWRFCDVS